MTVEEIRGGNGNYEKFPVGLRVLAVDDDPICLKLLETLLRKCQYQVTTTSQARTALKMLRDNTERFDLVISDVHMPDMDGFKLLELVGLELDLPVIMLSANSDPKLVMKGVTHGACDYLVKPVRIEELRNIWQHVLRRKKFDSNNSNKSGDQDHGASREGNESSPLMSNADPNGKFNRKRKDEGYESEENDRESEDPTTQKKPRVVWLIELHQKFVAAVNQLGIENAVPKRILDLMDVEGLTRENVASHLQKYRLYLRRISTATQQANMAAALGVHDSRFMRMPQFDGLGDFQNLGRITNTPFSHYTSGGGMLGRLNCPTNINLCNLTPSGPIQPTLSQNTGLFQGITSSLGLDQLQQDQCITGTVDFNNMDDSRMFTSGNNSMMFHEKGGFGNQSSLNTDSFDSEPFNAGEFSNMQQNSVLPTEPFLNQLPFNCNNSSNGPFLHSDSMNLEDSRNRMTCQENSSQKWRERQKQNYRHTSNNNFVSPFNQRMDSFLSGKTGGEGAALIQNGKSKLESGYVSQSYDLLDDLMTAMIKREQDGTLQP